MHWLNTTFISRIWMAVSSQRGKFPHLYDLFHRQKKSRLSPYNPPKWKDNSTSRQITLEKSMSSKELYEWSDRIHALLPCRKLLSFRIFSPEETAAATAKTAEITAAAAILNQRLTPMRRRRRHSITEQLIFSVAFLLSLMNFQIAYTFWKVTTNPKWETEQH